MAALRTIGAQDASGAWTVSGQKIFITSGHGKYHFVIARTAGSSTGNGSRGGGENGSGENGSNGFSNGTGNGGLKDLSMFLVRAYRDEPDGRRTRLASIDRLEEKLGHHASVTAALTFNQTPAELVGKPGDGFRQMLELMNHARLGVGFEAIGVCEAAFRMARAYAADRRSMGKTIDRHELIADYLDEMEIDIVGLRALAMYAAFHEEVGLKLQWFGGFSNPHASGGNGSNGKTNGHKKGSTDPADEARNHRVKARRVLPLLKYTAAEKAVEMARRCLQIHGGNGYMREFGAEKLLRDALVLPIYEGTSQIQALMATKDTLGAILKAPQEFVKRFAQARFRSLSARDELDRRVARLQCLALGAEQHIIRRLATAKVKSTNAKSLASWRQAFKHWDPRRDFSFALLHAERLTRLLTDVEIAGVLLSQAHRDPERRPLLERYLSRAEPRARFLHDEITSTGVSLLGRLAENREVTAAQG
jgi:alkylation response protein AidB-like acyl-CoA dehydrogenase